MAPPPAAGGDVLGILGREWCGDLFLARACEERTPGAWAVLTRRFVPAIRAGLTFRRAPGHGESPRGRGSVCA